MNDLDKERMNQGMGVLMGKGLRKHELGLPGADGSYWGVEGEEARRAA